MKYIFNLNYIYFYIFLYISLYGILNKDVVFTRARFHSLETDLVHERLNRRWTKTNSNFSSFQVSGTIRTGQRLSFFRVWWCTTVVLFSYLSWNLIDFTNVIFSNAGKSLHPMNIGCFVHPGRSEGYNETIDHCCMLLWTELFDERSRYVEAVLV